MRTWTGRAFSINHHGDYSGDIHIIFGITEIQVPFEDIKNFVLDYLRVQSVNNLTNMSNSELELHFTDGFPPEDSPIWNDDSYRSNPELEIVKHGQEVVVSAVTPPRPDVPPAPPPPSAGKRNPTGDDYNITKNF